MKRSVEYCKRIIIIEIHQFNRERTKQSAKYQLFGQKQRQPNYVDNRSLKLRSAFSQLERKIKDFKGNDSS